MNYAERAVSFDCSGDQLVGVLAQPREPKPLGVVVVVGGPQYRAGSHRQFVQLARRLAEEGFAVLRFDCRGMGDSEGEARGFEDIGEDIGAAVNALTSEVAQVTQVALWGLCDGASAVLLYLDDRHDPRIKALCLANPWVRSAAGLARTHLKHYYLRRLGQREFWAKLASGRVGLKAVGELGRNVHTGLAGSVHEATDQPPFQQRMARACAKFAGPVLIALSEHDYTAREFDEFAKGSNAWRRVLDGPLLEAVAVPGADHTFSVQFGRAAVEQATLRTLEAAAP